MNETCFVEKVKRFFSFLESEHGFRVTCEMNSPMLPRTDGYVEYSSGSLAVEIDSERGCAAARFHRLQDGGKYSLDPVSVHEYLATSAEEKRLLLSSDPADERAADSLFNRKFLLLQPGWRAEPGSNVDELELRLGQYAGWLKAFAGPCGLDGDFAQWPAMYEYKIQRGRANLLRDGRDELAYARVQDMDGSWKLVKQSIYQDDLAYVEKLKREFAT